MGTLLYYLLWPLIWLYAPLQLRVRIIVLVDKDILKVRNWLGPRSFQLPGGGLKFHESVLQAACRELQEETGIVCAEKNMKQLTLEPVIVKSAGLLFRYHYVCIKLDKKPPITLGRDVTAYAWRPLDSRLIPATVIRYI